MRLRILPKFAVLIACCFSLGSASTSAQTKFRSTTDLPDEIKQLIAQAPRQKVIEVTGTKHLSDRVNKTDLLIFRPGGILELDDTTDESIVLIAKSVQFQDGSMWSSISEPPNLKGDNGKHGDPGAQGSPNWDPGNNGGQGRRGGPGGAGGSGGPGQSLHLPNVYLIFGALNDINPNPGPVIRLSIRLDGAQGGNGGDGGSGGIGGNGEKGWHASCHSIGPVSFCDSGPGPGGDGGAGGPGGEGGAAAPGGDGANLYVCGPNLVLQQSEQFAISNKGGQPGLPGHGGVGGGRSNGGQSGVECDDCNHRDAGRQGTLGGMLGDGPISNQIGKDGSITFVTLDVGQFFP